MANLYLASPRQKEKGLKLTELEIKEKLQLIPQKYIGT